VSKLPYQLFLQLCRGMAVEDPTAPHGLKLTIKDYPFTNDGLILWDTIKLWVTDYIKLPKL
jgi:lipoxygenase